jgi:hypothetical protein
MKFSLTQIQKIYTDILHRDALKQPYAPARDWYVLVVIVSACALFLNIGGRMLVFQDQDTGENTFSVYGTYSLDIDVMHEIIRLYEEKKVLYLEKLSEGVEAKDPAW